MRRARVASVTWTPEKDDMLRSMLADGYSSSLIANELGFTRNAVIGRKHRLGLR